MRPKPDCHFTALRAANVARQREWDPAGKIPALFRCTELAGEAGEAANVVKKLEREALGIAGSRATAAELAAELADVVICVDLLAMHYGIDLGAAVIEKFNATSAKIGSNTTLAGEPHLGPMRPEWHGGALFWRMPASPRYCTACDGIGWIRGVLPNGVPDHVECKTCGNSEGWPRPAVAP